MMPCKLCTKYDVAGIPTAEANGGRAPRGLKQIGSTKRDGAAFVRRYKCQDCGALWQTAGDTVSKLAADTPVLRVVNGGKVAADQVHTEATVAVVTKIEEPQEERFAIACVVEPDEPPALAALRAAVADLPAGKAPAAVVEPLLAKAWEYVDVHDHDFGGMEGYKLIGRTEGLTWNPPILAFDIERHGATVLGSTRADVQSWRVNIETRTAEMVGAKNRVVGKLAARLDVGALADDLFADLRAGQARPWLASKPDGTIRIVVGCLPGLEEGSAVNQTLTGRRRRFKAEIAKRVDAAGFVIVRPYVLRKK